MKKTFNLLLLALTMFSLLFVACSDSDDNDPEKSTAKAITAFKINDVTAQIDETNKVISIALPFGTDVTKLKPVVTISEKATVSPASEAEMNFTDPVKYTVTAEDGTVMPYMVTVVISTASDAKILSFVLETLDPKVEGVVSEEKKTVALTVPFGTDVRALVPTIGILGETISPESKKAQDFTKGKTYTVKAQDGTEQPYEVTVKVSDFAPSITSVDKEEIVAGDKFTIKGVFAVKDNQVQLIAGLKTFKLDVTEQSATSITVIAPLANPTEYELSVIADEQVAKYSKKLKLTNPFMPILTGMSESEYQEGPFKIIVKGEKLKHADLATKLFRRVKGSDHWIEVPSTVNEAGTEVSSKETITHVAIEYEAMVTIGDNMVSNTVVFKVVERDDKPKITSLDKEQYEHGKGSIIATGMNLAPANTATDKVTVHYKKVGGITASAEINTFNAEGTTLTIPNYSSLSVGKYMLSVGVNGVVSNEIAFEITPNTDPVPVIIDIDNYAPSYEDILTITGENFTTVEDTRVQAYRWNSQFEEFEEWGLPVKPKSVTATTISFIFNYGAGDRIKYKVEANGRKSQLSKEVVGK